MRVLLVNPRPLWDRLGPMERFSPAIPPLGVVWPATVLRELGHDVMVVDQHGLKWTNSQLLSEVRSFGPELVGFSCLTFAMDGVEAAVEAMRKGLPSVKVVLGNLHATIFHEELVRRGVADFVVRGEGEEVLAELVGSLERGEAGRGVAGLTRFEGGRVVVEADAGEVDMGRLPVPDWSLVAGVRYEAFRLMEFDVGPLAPAVQASRGCKYKCHFCSQNIMYRGVRVRPVDDVIAEIRELHERLGVTTVGFVDANFPPDREYGLQFARTMRDSGLSEKVRWFTEIRIDLVDEELIRECAEAGMALIQFGIESGDADVLGVMRKGTVGRDLAEPFRWCKENGVLTVGLFVLGMPGESEAQAKRTIKTALKLDPDLVKFSVATPYPGSGLWFDYHDDLKDAPTHKFSGWLDPARGGAHLLEGHTLPGKKLARLQRGAMRRFYLRPRKLAALFGKGLLREETLRDGFLSLVEGLFKRA